MFGNLTVLVGWICIGEIQGQKRAEHMFLACGLGSSQVAVTIRMSGLVGSGAHHTVLSWEAFGGHVPLDQYFFLKWRWMLMLQRKIDIRQPGKGNSNSHGARPVY